MQISKLEKNIITLIYILAAGIVVAQIVAGYTIGSVLFYASFLAVIALWITVMVRRKISNRDILVIVIIVLSGICVVLNAAMENASLSFEYFKKMFMFWATLVFFQTAAKLTIDKGLEKRIRNIILLIAAFMILVFLFADPSVTYRWDGRITEYLTMGFTNPNLIALFLACVAIFLFNRFLYRCQIQWKVIYLALFLLLGWMILKTQARTSLIALAADIVIIFYINTKRKTSFSMKKTPSMFWAVFPLLFSIGYLWLYSANRLQIFDFLSSEGKGLDARVDTWNFAFGHWQESPWIGAYSQISFGTGASQMHNTHVDILVSYGVVVFALTVIWLFLLIWNDGKAYSKNGMFYQIGFICIIILGIGEAAVFAGGVGIYIFAGMFLLLRNVHDEEPNGIADRTP